MIHIAVITFNNSDFELERLSRSIDCAVSHFGKSDNFLVSVIDNGAVSVWPKMRTKMVKRQSQGNVGFAVAANILIKHLSEEGGRVIILVNPDGAMHAKCLTELLQTHSQYPGDLIEAKQFPEEHPKDYDLRSGATAWCSGACLLLPATTLAQIGGFDERMFLYMEDIDLSWRARVAGFETRMAPRALFMHDVIGRAMPSKIQAYNLASQRILGWKWGCRKHQLAAETELLRLNLIPSIDVLPALGDMPEQDKKAWRIADFTNWRYFSTGRW
jgi:N-acetylglucosaminyl-diphospho-decaprenol L-rhamnosyltransferase